MHLKKPKKTGRTQACGNLYEKKSECFLIQQGYRTVATQSRCRGGEIDLIMEHSKQAQMLFVDVRYRKHAHYGSAAESVHPHKQRRIMRAAEYFLMQNPHYQKHIMRFEVLAWDGTPAKLNWIKNAFHVE